MSSPRSASRCRRRATVSPTGSRGWLRRRSVDEPAVRLEEGVGAVEPADKADMAGEPPFRRRVMNEAGWRIERERGRGVRVEVERDRMRRARGDEARCAVPRRHDEAMDMAAKHGLHLAV